MSDLKSKASKGILWSSIERFSGQGVVFVIGIILARILSPSDYGLIGMLAVFISISDIFIQSGFGSALIQKKDRNEVDFATTFYFNIVVGIIAYSILFFLAPFIANFYNQPLLVPLARVLGLTLIINSFAVVQRSKYTIGLDFKTQTKASLSAIFIGGIVGVYMAYSDYGVWALVGQTLSRRLIEVILLWYFSKWLPKESFSFESFKGLFSFGSKLLASALLESIYQNIYLIIIGKYFSASDLGYYTRAKQFNELPSSNITSVLVRVTFPLLSNIQDDKEKLRAVVSKIIKYSALIVFPLMIGLASLSDPLIRVLLTDKWIDVVWMLQLLCFAGMLYPVHALNLTLLQAIGRSDLFLRLEIIKKVMATVIVIISLSFGIKGLLIGIIIFSYLALVINLYYTKKVISYGFFQQMKDILPIFTLSIIMGIVMWVLISYINSNILKLLIGFIIGFSFYVPTAWLFNLGNIKSIPEMLKHLKK